MAMALGFLQCGHRYVQSRLGLRHRGFSLGPKGQEMYIVSSIDVCMK
jgi:hypothetical protein